MRILTAVIFLFISSSSFAVDDIVQLNIEGQSANQVPAQARSEALKDALDKGTLSVMANLIGAQRIEKNKNVVQERILTETAKYIQYYKAQEPVTAGEKTTMQVTLKVSVSALRELLDQEGLLVQNDDVYTVLPLIKVYERKIAGRQYSWWKDDFVTAPQILKDQVKSFAVQFQQTQVKNFKIIDPLKDKVYQQVSDRFKKDNIESSEAIILAQELKMPLLILGESFVAPGDSTNKYKAQLKLTLYHVDSSRILAEVTKAYELTSNKPNPDLVIQQALRQVYADGSRAVVSELQQQLKKGLFGSQTVQLVLNADLNYLDLESVKKEFLLRIPELRTIKERRMEKGAFTLEADLIGSMNNLAKKIETSSFENLEITIDSVNSSVIQLKVRKKRG